MNLHRITPLRMSEPIPKEHQEPRKAPEFTSYKPSTGLRTNPKRNTRSPVEHMSSRGIFVCFVCYCFLCFLRKFWEPRSLFSRSLLKIKLSQVRSYFNLHNPKGRNKCTNKTRPMRFKIVISNNWVQCFTRVSLVFSLSRMAVCRNYWNSNPCTVLCLFKKSA